MPQTIESIFKRRTEEVARLIEARDRHLANGYPERAEIFEELLVEAKARLEKTPRPNPHDTPIMARDRALLAQRIDAGETSIPTGYARGVGDHPPEIA